MGTPPRRSACRRGAAGDVKLTLPAHMRGLKAKEGDPTDDVDEAQV